MLILLGALIILSVLSAAQQPPEIADVRAALLRAEGNFNPCTPVFFAILVPAHLYFSRCASDRERSEREREQS